MTGHTKKELLEKIEEYAKSFTPEWNFNLKQPDAGTALALIFAEQMSENTEKYHTLWDYYQEEFNIFMPNLSRKPPKPASATVLVKLVEHSVPGIFLRQNTRFLAKSEDTEIIFESCAPLYLTEATVDTIFLSCGGEIRLIQGQFYKDVPAKEEKECIKLDKFTEFPLFYLENKEDITQKQMLIIYHDFLFSGNNDLISIKFSGAEKLLCGLLKGRFKLYCQGGESQSKNSQNKDIQAGNSLIPVDNWHVQKDELLITFPKELQTYPFLIIQSEEPLQTDIMAEEISLSAVGKEKKPQFVCTDTSDCDIEEFFPFSEVLAVHNQCYIGCDHVFSRKKAKITLDFELRSEIHRMGEQKTPEKNLKIIKKRAPEIYERPLSESFAEEVSFEYYNGKGWKNLKLLTDIRGLFQKDEKRSVSLSFFCPEDWETVNIGAYEGRCLRIRLIKAENCYLQPCIHHFPVIDKLYLSYTYKGIFFLPDKAERLCGFQKTDVAFDIAKKQLLKLFEGVRETQKNRLYLGFEKPLLGGPVSLWIQKKEQITGKTRQLSFFYYSRDGFKRLKAVDYTDGLSHSGTILFLPPEDMQKISLYSEERYYLCIESSEQETSLEKITQICFNGVEVKNKETEKEEEYYIDVSKPNMTFSINCQNLLELELWVNETGEYSQKKMKELLKENPKQFYAEYGYSGEIKRFFVKWKEEGSESLKNPRTYRLDCTNHKIIFGDGSKKKIPKITADVAFKVIISRCRGAAANVEAYAINDISSNILYIDKVYNPLPACGGSYAETVSAAKRRGAGILSSHGRLITEADYIREIMGFSDCIDKVKCVADHEKITIVLLMKDCQKGFSSFYTVRADLKKHLAKISDISILPEQIQIIEPVFLEIHTCIWLDTTGFGDTFELISGIQNMLTQYFNPINGKNGQGWEPGEIPHYSQILMRLNTVKQWAVIKRVAVTVRYTDETGIYECGLENLKPDFKMVIKSGEHKIYTN
ncbi:hypothetical protein AALB81_03745 [Lachnospiraceae bacterium 48-33]